MDRLSLFLARRLMANARPTAGTERRRSGRPAPAVAVAAALVLVAAVAVPSAAVTPITIEPVTPRSELPDPVAGQLRIKEPGGATDVINMPSLSRVVTAKITVQPGAMFPWHTHAGPVLVTIVQGELAYISAEDCTERTYGPGQAFVDAGHGHVHSAANRTGGETIFYATFLQVAATGPLTLTDGVTPPDCA